MTTHIFHVKDQTNGLELSIRSYKTFQSPKSLLLIKERKMEIEKENKEYPFLNIYKVQSIVACEIRVDALNREVLVALYLDENHEMEAFVLSGLPNDYISHEKNERVTLLDYQSYLEICEITGEQKMSFFDFYNKIKNQSLEVNSLLDHKDGLKNVNQMQELYKK